MEKYTIYCTEEQTKKARELGAPINNKTKIYYICTQPSSGYEEEFEEATDELIIPTAEQMIGWLEEQGIKEFSIYGANDNKWRYDVWTAYGRTPICSRSEGYISRKEATLAAIEKALTLI